MSRRSQDATESGSPLSYSQELMLFLQQLNPASWQYNVPFGYRLSGPLDRKALELAVKKIVERHDVLRTTFAIEPHPQQRLRKYENVPLSFTDLSEAPREQREQLAHRMIRESTQAPFDLISGPVLRARLFCITPEEHILSVVAHHIAVDTPSIQIFTKDLIALYETFAAGRKSPLAPLRNRYADFVAWQRQHLSGEVLDRQLSYWRKQLTGMRHMELPATLSHNQLSEQSADTVEFMISGAVAQSIRDLGRRHNVSLFMTLFAALAALLRRYGAHDDIVIGTPISGRTRSEFESVIGYFLNMLALRVDVSGNPAFSDLLQRARTAALDAYANQDLPFARLIEELNPVRVLDRTPLVQVILVVQHQPPQNRQSGALRFQHIPLRCAAAKFDLAVSVQATGLGLAGDFVYNPERFHRDTIEIMASRFVALLDRLANQPEVRIADLGVESDAEKQKLLERGDNPRRSTRNRRSLAQWFESQARRTPRAVAVECGAEALSYAELNRRANQLAWALKKRGVRPETSVVIWLSRSLHAMIAILGVLKAGGAYVPIDERYPAQRRELIIEGANASLIITESSLEDGLGANPIDRIVLDRFADRMSAEPAGNPPVEVLPDNLAYFLFTSGSTGVPKGVMITHRAASNLVDWLLTRYPAEELKSVICGTSFCFDLSIFELWSAWSSGGRVVLADNALELADRPVTLVNTVPFIMRELLRLGRLPDGVQVVNLAGEVLEPSLVHMLRENSPAVKIVNLYGPTETTTYSTGYWVTADMNGGATVPIGRPLANTRVYALDQQMNMAPAGMSGELFIGGAGLARGYAGRPDLTAANFVPDPYSPESGARMYRTGDLVRWTRDGELEYQGRIDQQVKIRGFRIELGEIEAVARNVSWVRDAVVTVRGESSGKSLIGYATIQNGDEADVTGLKRQLRERLPAYMLPAQWVVIEKLPLTTNGKLDRKALPAADEAITDEASEYAAPGTALEQLLARTWQEALEVPRVGAHDDFFNRGGHSLAALQVNAKIEAALGIRIPLRLLFQYTTVATLAEQIELLQDGPHGIASPPITRIPNGQPLPLAIVQEHRLLSEAGVRNPLPFNTALALNLLGDLNADALDRAIAALVARHEVFRTEIHRTGEPLSPETASRLLKWQDTGIFVQRVLDDAAPVIAFHDLAKLEPAAREIEAQRIYAEEIGAPFDYAKAPLLRPHLLKLGSGKHRLIAGMPHLIADAWTLKLIREDLERSYSRIVAGNAGNVSPSDVRFGDYAGWQRERLARGDFAEALAYWRQRWVEYSGAQLEYSDFPFAKPAPGVPSGRGGREQRSIDAALASRLRRFASAHALTLHTLMRGAFYILLKAYSPKDRIAVWGNFANRVAPETAEMSGCFANRHVIGADLGGDPAVMEALDRVRHSVLEAYQHQELPLPVIQVSFMEQPDAPRVLSGAYVSFDLIIWKKPRTECAGLIVEPAALPEIQARQALEVVVSDTGESLTVTARYAADRFAASGVGAMLDDYQLLLTACVETSSTGISNVTSQIGMQTV